jgi:hypothetical protein
MSRVLVFVRVREHLRNGTHTHWRAIRYLQTKMHCAHAAHGPPSNQAALSSELKHKSTLVHVSTHLHAIKEKL